MKSPRRAALLLSLLTLHLSLFLPASPGDLASYEVGDPLAPQLAYEKFLRTQTPEQRAAIETELIALIAAPKTTTAAKRVFLGWLGWIGTQKSIPTLAEAAKTPDLAHAAVSALAVINAPEPNDGLGAGSAITSLIMYPPSEATRIEAINAILVDFSLTENFSLIDGDETILLNSPRGIQFLAKTLTTDPTPHVETAQRIVSLDPTNPALAPSLTNSNPHLRNIIACGMATSGNADAIKILLDRFADIPADTQARMMRTLAATLPPGNAAPQLGTSAALPLIKRALSSENLDVRLAAIDAVGTCGNETSVEKLTRLLASENKSLSTAAFTALTQLPGCDGKTNAALRSVPIPVTIAPQLRRILAQRQDRTTFPNVLAATKISDDTARAAAFEAVALLVRPGDFPEILPLAAYIKRPTDRREWTKALYASAAVHPNPAEAIALIEKQLPDAKPADRPILIATLTMIDAPEAKAVLHAMLTSPDIDTRKETIRALSSARSRIAYELLVERITAAPDTTERLLAQRGAIDTVDHLAIPTGDKIAIYRTLWETAQTQEAKDAIIAALKRMNSSRARALLRKLAPSEK